MREAEETSWTLIRGAAAGCAPEREAFALRYQPLLTAYLRARWRQTALIGEVEDAVQEIFLACFRADGALSRVEEERGGGFRAYLYGVARNVALVAERRFGQRRAAFVGGASGIERQPADDESLSAAFDRAFARSLLEEARALHRERAAIDGPPAVRRVELLRLRFEEGLPIREIARRWDEDPARLHHEYARAREEFRAALLRATAFHHPGSPEAVERECARLIDLF